MQRDFRTSMARISRQLQMLEKLLFVGIKEIREIETASFMTSKNSQNVASAVEMGYLWDIFNVQRFKASRTFAAPYSSDVKRFCWRELVDINEWYLGYPLIALKAIAFIFLCLSPIYHRHMGRRKQYQIVWILYSSFMEGIRSFFSFWRFCFMK